VLLLRAAPERRAAPARRATSLRAGAVEHVDHGDIQGQAGLVSNVRISSLEVAASPPRLEAT